MSRWKDVFGMDPTLLFAFWGMVFLLIVVPGPDWAYILASGLRDRSVYPAVAGILIGYLILTAIVAAGLGVLVSDNSVVLTIITIIGAGYLSYLGVGLLANPSSLPTPADTTRSDPEVGTNGQKRSHETEVATAAAKAPVAMVETPWWTRVLRGIGVSGLNPKGLLIFVAMLPQFTGASSSWPIPAQMVLLGLIFTASCAVFYTALGLTTRTILRTRPTVSHLVSRISGAAMILVGLFLLAERLITLLT
jgi:threonine/homoserine/homoserine lactone efflux protein